MQKPGNEEGVDTINRAFRIGGQIEPKSGAKLKGFCEIFLKKLY